MNINNRYDPEKYPTKSVIIIAPGAVFFRGFFRQFTQGVFLLVFLKTTFFDDEARERCASSEVFSQSTIEDLLYI